MGGHRNESDPGSGWANKSNRSITSLTIIMLGRCRHSPIQPVVIPVIINDSHELYRPNRTPLRPAMTLLIYARSQAVVNILDLSNWTPQLTLVFSQSPRRVFRWGYSYMETRLIKLRVQLWGPTCVLLGSQMGGHSWLYKGLGLSSKTKRLCADYRFFYYPIILKQDENEIKLWLSAVSNPIQSFNFIPLLS